MLDLIIGVPYYAKRNADIICVSLSNTKTKCACKTCTTHLLNRRPSGNIIFPLLSFLSQQKITLSYFANFSTLREKMRKRRAAMEVEQINE
jgi:hypothetical protein